ncbi:sulfatase-like hydrolase/transferase [Candidatus Sumerlaeota bacterium]|nr:sulfatase-like hydrolase/transferase [Candidatus Sumerlaeota bacterium]
MQSQKFLRLALVSCVVFCVLPLQFGSQCNAATQPNVLLIQADDLGIGDLGCYGQPKISTPFLNQLAADGMRFTQFYSGSAEDAPARCTMLTGLHTGHACIRADMDYATTAGLGQHPLPAGQWNLGFMLSDAGYATCLIGKWGLGGGWDDAAGQAVNTEAMPNNQGWDAWHGYLDLRVGRFYYPTHLWSDMAREAQTGNTDPYNGGALYAPDSMKQQAIDFIDAHASEPWLLYYAAPAPHASLQVPQDSLNYYMLDAVSSAFEPEQVYSGGDFSPQSKPRAAYAAMITRLDSDIGEILQKIDDLALSDDTIVIFTSDNGPANEGGVDRGYFDSSGGLRGGKQELYEGGIRAPLIVKWPGCVKAGTVCGHICAAWDLLPTIAEACGAVMQEESDGISLMPALTEADTQAEHAYLYWELNSHDGGLQAVRMGDWKAVRSDVLNNPEAEFELYDLCTDPAEINNVALLQPDVIEQIKQIVGAARTVSEDFPFPDLEGYEAWRPRALEKSGWTLVRVDSESKTDGEDATSAFDGDETTWWSTSASPSPDPLPHEIVIDLGRERRLNGFVYLPRTDGETDGMIKDFEFYIGADPDTLDTVVASGQFPQEQDYQCVDFDCTRGRYVMLRAISEWGSQNTFTCLAELEILECAETNPPDPAPAELSRARHWEILE